MPTTQNATPPTDFPKQVIVMDKGLVARHPDKAFYLRLVIADGVDTVTLEGASSMPQVRRMARDLGYAPTHHMTINEAGHADRPFPYL